MKAEVTIKLSVQEMTEVEELLQKTRQQLREYTRVVSDDALRSQINETHNQLYALSKNFQSKS